MEPQGSLPQSQVPAMCLYPPTYQSRSEVYPLTLSQLDTFLQLGVVSTSPNPQAGGRPLVGCLRLLFNIFAATPLLEAVPPSTI
jgi:hypothetical protein